MKSEKAIGGYFELEIRPGGAHYHGDALRFSSGRGALSYILKIARPRKVYLPFYICNVVFEPILLYGINYEYLNITSDFKIRDLPTLADDEMLLYNDYFGLMGNYVAELEQRYGDKLIIDATQSFFRARVGNAWIFNSARKFFGVPDGSYVYVPHGVDSPFTSEFRRNSDYIYDHLFMRLNGDPEPGYQTYRRNELIIDSQILQMSVLTEVLLTNVDYEYIKARRQANYEYLAERLESTNLLRLFPSSEDVPYFYPYLTQSGLKHEDFIQRRIYVTKLWLEMPIHNGSRYDYERSLASSILPLPIDHRYGRIEMDRILEVIGNCEPSITRYQNEQAEF